MKKITELRYEMNLKQTELAKMLSTTQRTISNWENGISEPSISYLTQLSKIFNVSIDYLLDLEDDFGNKNQSVIERQEQNPAIYQENYKKGQSNLEDEAMKLFRLLERKYQAMAIGYLVRLCEEQLKFSNSVQ